MMQLVATALLEVTVMVLGREEGAAGIIRHLVVPVVPLR